MVDSGTVRWTADTGFAEAQRRIAQCDDLGSEELSLADLNLKELPTEIGSLTWLKHLDLSGNSIGPESARRLAKLTSLIRLDLQNNKVGPEGARQISRLPALTHLRLGFNFIGDEGAKHLSALTRLVRLNLWFNEITDEGAKHIADLADLTSVQLAYNNVGPSGPRHLCKLTALTNLDLGNNKIGNDGVQPLAELNSLTFLGLYNNEIGSAGAMHLKQLTRLTELNLQNNEFGSAGVRYLAGLSALTSLNLVDNNIDIEGARHLAGLTLLSSLNLEDNEIGSQGVQHLSGLKNLTSLNLADNKIGSQAVAHLSGLTALKSLNLAKNPIGSEGVRHLSGLTSLCYLFVERTGEIDLRAFLRLRQLQFVNLSYCVIADPCRDFWFLDALKKVDLSGARLGSVPQELLGSDCLPRLRAYFDALDRGTPAELADFKLMILGNGQIGKTQLARRLRGNRYDPLEKSTHGVTIAAAGLPPAGKTIKPLRAPRAVTNLWGLLPRTRRLRQGEIPLKIWDFGGQDIYHSTHALFLRTRAVFPILWTPGAENNEEHIIDGVPFRNYPLAYWLTYVNQLAGLSAPVLLAQTQVDKPGDKQDLPLDPRPFDFRFKPADFGFSAKTGHGLETLLDQLRGAVDWLKAQRGAVEVGAGWAKLKTHIEDLQAEDAARPAAQRRHRTMTRAEFRDLAAKIGGVEDETEADVLLRFLHDLGTLFHDGAAFDELVILDQQWALDAIYAVFNREKGAYRLLTRTAGRFSKADLHALVWGGHQDREQDVFLSMMRACAICTPLKHVAGSRGETIYLAPDLTPELKPSLEDRWDATAPALEASFNFTMLPPHLMRLIMVAVADVAGVDGVYWREGVYFYDQEASGRAVIEQSRPDLKGWAGTLHVRTQGWDAGKLLERLTELVERQIERAGVKPTEVNKPQFKRAHPDPDTPSGGAIIVPGPEPYPRPPCFISYASGDASSAGQARTTAFDDVHAIVSRDCLAVFDREHLTPGQKIIDFMRRSAGVGRAVVILSEKYLKSEYCMFELRELQRQHGDAFHERVLVYDLADAAIYTPADLQRIEAHWQADRNRRENQPLGPDERAMADAIADIATYCRRWLGDIAARKHPRTRQELEPLEQWLKQPVG